MKNYDFKLTLRQYEAWKHLTSEEPCAVLYGGAKGGGKSFLFCLWTMSWVQKLIDDLGLTPCSNPPILGFLGRKQAVDFHKTTLETFRRTVPSEIYTIKEQAKEIVFKNSAKVWFGGLDDSDTINKFNSAELAFIAIDQAEETERQDVSVLQASLRFKYKGITPQYKELYTANPAECWLKSDFIDSGFPRKYYVPALPSDNPHLPDGYCERLKDSFKHSNALLNAYLYGDWSALSATNVLITSMMMESVKTAIFHNTERKVLVVCDPSLGGDECVINVMANNEIINQKILVGERDTMKIAGEMLSLGNRHKTSDYALDTIGIGRGIADRLRELVPKGNIQYINSSENAFDKDRFYNRRAEMWWFTMQKFIDKKIPYPRDELTRKQLQLPRFKVINSNGCIQLEHKDESKKRAGLGIDRADTFVYGIWANQFAKPMKLMDRWDEDRLTSDIILIPNCI